MFGIEGPAEENCLGVLMDSIRETVQNGQLENPELKRKQQ